MPLHRSRRVTDKTTQQRQLPAPALTLALRFRELSVSQTRALDVGPFPENTVGRLNLLVLSDSWFIAHRRSLSLSITSLFRGEGLVKRRMPYMLEAAL